MTFGLESSVADSESTAVVGVDLESIAVAGLGLIVDLESSVDCLGSCLAPQGTDLCCAARTLDSA